MRRLIMLAAMAAISFSVPAHARRHAHTAPTQAYQCGLFTFDQSCVKPALSEAEGRPSARHGRVRHGRGVVIGGAPSGCPRRAFCGCGASIEVFGRPVRNLFLARAWFKFPRAAPAPGMVAVRSGHVFVLRQHIAGNVWLSHDSNSGKGLTRIHPRSIAGFTIVNPRA